MYICPLMVDEPPSALPRGVTIRRELMPGSGSARKHQSNFGSLRITQNPLGMST